MSFNYPTYDYSVDMDYIKKLFYAKQESEKRMAKIYETGINVNNLIREQCKEYFKTHLNSLYGQAIYADTDSIYTKENDMRINDFIVLHADGQPVMVKKESITGVARMADGTTRVDAGNQIWITDDKYNDVVKRLFE